MTCQKIPYDTKADALTDAKFIKNQQQYRSKHFGNKKKAGRKLRPYFCYFCQKYHLSTQRKRNR